jgi:ribulose kinase
VSKYAIGVDFGTESGRAVLVDVSNGKEIIKIIEAEWQGTDQIELRTILLPSPLVVRQSSLCGKE